MVIFKFVLRKEFCETGLRHFRLGKFQDFQRIVSSKFGTYQQSTGLVRKCQVVTIY